jgi:Protein of unknown function (DUF3304)
MGRSSTRMGGAIVISTSRSVRRCAAVKVVALALAGCQPVEQMKTPAAAVPSSAAEPDKTTEYKPRNYSLGIVGYNYTDTAIVDYIVNGKGAFNLAVSTETSGGGKTVCCFSWRPDGKVPFPVAVEWTRGNDRWCRKTVMLTDPGPSVPTTLEVHFFPDRRIEAAVTDTYSPPRLRLTRVGGAFRVGEDLRAERARDQALDEAAAECQTGDFLTNRNAPSTKTNERKERP